MQVTCPAGHEQEIADPSDDSWLVTGHTEKRIDEATFPDGSVVEVERDVFVPELRQITWKCGAPTPTDDNPNCLCGLVSTITEAVEG